MYPAPIEAYYAPKTIDEALACLAEAGDDAMFIAGGMSLMQAMKARLVTPRALIDLNEVEELGGLARGPRGVTVRPLTRYRELAATSALHGALQAIGDAAATVGDRQVRNAGTIGGSLCWNYVASCMPNVCLCLDATLVLASLDGGERAVPVEEFLVGPLETALREDELLTEINCALHARVLLRRDVDYLVREGRIGMIDEFTGRVVPDRHWPDGLQAALEAKEGLEPDADGEILGSMSLWHYLRGYPFLCGMTGTARDAAAELEELYDLEVVVIPTHRPMIRVDRPDVVFTHREAKERAVVDEIRRVHEQGRPVLAGTLTVAESERLAGRLRAAGVACEVLNAKNDAAEARLVARAGRPGAVTISTNMAGRGTDIRLGADEAERERVVALGGLYVIGTNRHESRRIDLQLRGRAGRQGDPGESRFFVSLEDNLLVRYGIRNLIPARFMPARQDGPLDHPVIRREVARAQRIVEGQNQEIRRTLSRYSEIVEQQRRRLMDRRQALLDGSAAPDVWRGVPVRHHALVGACGAEAVRRAEVAVTLHHLDRAWAEHLARCADLREGIHLVQLGQQDPLRRFTDEAVDLYERMEVEMDDAVRGALDTVRVDGGHVDLGEVGIKGPASTWTYVVSDNPFRDQIGGLLTGPGRNSIAIFAAMWLMPLMIAWGLVDRYLRKRPRRRADPYR